MRAFGSALGTTVVTLGGLAGATLLVSSGAMMVVRRVVKHQEVGAQNISAISAAPTGMHASKASACARFRRLLSAAQH